MASFRHTISTDPSAPFPAEAGRYHLYVTLSCPFACRALAALYLKGLDALVGVSVAHPVHQFTKPEDPSDGHKGWTFVDPATDAAFRAYNGQTYSTDGCVPDTVKHAAFVRDLYELVDTEPRRYTVPLLWDTKTGAIVCNESADLVRIFDSGFGDLAPNAAVAIVPAALAHCVAAANDGIAAAVSAACVKVAVAPTRATYDADLRASFDTIQALDDLLGQQRYAAGTPALSETDIRLFHTLLRFDYSQRADTAFNLKDYANVVHVRYRCEWQRRASWTDGWTDGLCVSRTTVSPRSVPSVCDPAHGLRAALAPHV